MTHQMPPLPPEKFPAQGPIKLVKALCCMGPGMVAIAFEGSKMLGYIGPFRGQVGFYEYALVFTALLASIGATSYQLIHHK